MAIKYATLPLTLAFCVLGGMASAEAEKVTEEIFIATHVGKCINYTGGSEGRQCYRADGTTDYDDKSYGKDNGNWKWENGRYCVAYSAAPDSWTCQDFVVKDGVYSYANGEYSWTIE
ncbi:MAG: hypothetical protein FJX28_09435 [Alphaproteobacteria bacterium]|nr:hypothetical protein [Alphaproteobacteria bacterium]